MRKLHEPLIADLIRGIVLVVLFIEVGDGFVPGNRLLQFGFAPFLHLFEIRPLNDRS